jgi:hypothetical protein
VIPFRRGIKLSWLIFASKVNGRELLDPPYARVLLMHIGVISLFLIEQISWPRSVDSFGADKPMGEALARAD